MVEAGEGYTGTREMVEEAALSFAQAAAVDIPGFDFEIWGEVPIARGLGSSATLRAGVVAALNHLTGEPLDRRAMIGLTSRLDNNSPDNACAAFEGGFCVAKMDPKTFAYQDHLRFELPEDLVFVAASPEYKVMTEDARRVLPKMLPFRDVVTSANSLAYLVAVLVSGEFERLKDAVHDCIHQPYREHLNPFGHESIEAGCHSGAYAGWLSGSGSTVICLCAPSKAQAVSEAMQQAYRVSGVGSRAYRLFADNRGVRVDDE